MQFVDKQDESNVLKLDSRRRRVYRGKREEGIILAENHEIIDVPDKLDAANMAQANSQANSYELIALLATAWSILVDDLHTELARAGYPEIRPAHGFAFQLLAPNGATGNELAEHLGVTKQAASQMIDFLEERGYVTRRPHPSDKRGKLVVLTQKGWDCIHAVEAIFATLQQRWIEVLGPERVATLQTDLRRLVTSSESGITSYRLRPTW